MHSAALQPSGRQAVLRAQQPKPSAQRQHPRYSAAQTMPSREGAVRKQTVSALKENTDQWGKSNTFQNVTPNSATMSPRTREDPAVLPSPTSETVLTVAAFGVISFIAILVVVVIVLVSVVSLRFKCRKNKESEDPQKPGSSGVSESCSTANGEKDSITLISMKNINMNNSKGCPTAEKVL
ncbi:endothelial cell-specific chemotaxis regulator isoform X4 [Manis pentadactyla]|uniref:endothelial cell-specific chemotaxis regulator isoform X4 n=1 Tax=Manis pentadactyla TaxID=143292 RepID=UPI00255CE0B9|nr:endothelial cell-specific chemotaxis regulator isoform X4 [Manis pentadactyla]